VSQNVSRPVLALALTLALAACTGPRSDTPATSGAMGHGTTAAAAPVLYDTLGG
jgi:hypothetical protein